MATPLRALVVALLPLSVLAAACEDKKGVSATATSATSVTTEPPRMTSATPLATTTAPSVAKEPDAIAAQHVLIAYRGAERAPKSVTRSKADAKKRAEEVVTKAQAGTDFTALVNEYSDDPGAKDRQGSLGKFTRAKMAKAFSDAAFALEVDKTSGVVETPFGFHVIKRNQ